MSSGKKKLGRPEVDTKPVMIRMSNDLIDQIDAYRRTQKDLPTRPEVIRRVMTDFLEAQLKAKG